MNIRITLNEVIRAFNDKLQITHNKYHPENEITGDTKNISQVIGDSTFNEDKDKFLEFLDECALEIYGHANEKDLGAMNAVNELFYEVLSKGHNLELYCKGYNNAVPATFFFLAKTSCKVDNIHFYNKPGTVFNGCDVLITADEELLRTPPNETLRVKILNDFNSDIDSDYTINSIKNINNIINDILEYQDVSYEEIT